MIRRAGIIIHPDELSTGTKEYFCDGTLSMLGIHPVGGLSAHKTLESLIEWVKRKEIMFLLDEMKDIGVRIEYEFHASSWLLERSEFERHPTWFREDVNGERTPNMNFCPMNKEAIGHVMKRASGLVKALKATGGSCFIWLDDSEDASCHCPLCSGLSPSEQQTIILNAILYALRQEDADAKLPYLAYFSTLEPPKNVLPSEGIFLEYAPMRRKHDVCIGDEANSSETDCIPSLLETFGKKDSRVLEYWLDNSKFSSWTKPPKKLSICSDIIKKDIDFYEQAGFEEASTFACYLGEDYFDLYGKPPIDEYIDIWRKKNSFLK